MPWENGVRCSESCWSSPELLCSPRGRAWPGTGPDTWRWRDRLRRASARRSGHRGSRRGDSPPAPAIRIALEAAVDGNEPSRIRSDSCSCSRRAGRTIFAATKLSIIRMWHYIDYPYKPPGQPASVPRRLRKRRIIVEAFQRNVAVVQSAARTTEKAVALCWIFHLMGDAHQPLHAVMLCSQPSFRGRSRRKSVLHQGPIHRAPTTAEPACLLGQHPAHRRPLRSGSGARARLSKRVPAKVARRARRTAFRNMGTQGEFRSGGFDRVSQRQIAGRRRPGSWKSAASRLSRGGQARGGAPGGAFGLPAGGFPADALVPRNQPRYSEVWKPCIRSARWTARIAAPCWCRWRTAGPPGCEATPAIRSREAFCAAKSRNIWSANTRPSGCSIRKSASAPKAKAGSSEFPGTRLSTRSQRG